jgi:hypothetical protein
MAKYTELIKYEFAIPDYYDQGGLDINFYSSETLIKIADYTIDIEAFLEIAEKIKYLHNKNKQPIQESKNVHINESVTPEPVIEPVAQPIPDNMPIGYSTDGFPMEEQVTTTPEKYVKPDKIVFKKLFNVEHKIYLEKLFCEYYNETQSTNSRDHWNYINKKIDITDPECPFGGYIYRDGKLRAFTFRDNPEHTFTYMLDYHNILTKIRLKYDLIDRTSDEYKKKVTRYKKLNKGK